MLRILALSLLLGLPAAAQNNDNSGVAGAMSEDASSPAKDRLAERIAQWRARAAELEAKGDVKAAEALRRRADRTERRNKSLEEKRRQRREERAGRGEKPAKKDAEKK